ncbi:MAG TPA: hypothetical protein VLF90_03230 [Patescibacteria group bacterium]|nr:hypothetical protein [Patescibacteria group bacterium]
MAKEKKQSQTVSAFELFSKSQEIVMRNLSSFVILNLLPAATLLGSMIAKSHSRDRTTSFSNVGIAGVPTYAIASLAGVGIALFVVVIIVSALIQAMLYSLKLQGAQGKTPDMSNLWEVGKKYWLRLFGLSIVVGLTIVVGLILFIIPGLIMIRRYFLAPYIMVEHNTGIMESMRRSAALTKPYPGAIWGIIGVSFLLSLPSIIPFLGAFISLALSVLYSAAPALRYEELKKLSA